MKNRWLIIALCFMLLLSGCTAQKPQDDEVITEQPGQKEQNMPENEEYDPDAEAISVESKTTTVLCTSDDYIVLDIGFEDKSRIYAKLYTDNVYLKQYELVLLTGEIAPLKEATAIDGFGPMMITHVIKEGAETIFEFDPDNMKSTGNIRYIGDDFIIFHMRSSRNIKVFVDDTSMYCINDYVRVKGVAKSVQPYTVGDAEVEFEVQDGEVEILPQVGEKKPVIYLYPEEETEVNVALTLDGELTCVYPEYDGAWQVTAKPDGTLVDKKGREYYCLYWEGETYKPLVYDESVGFVIKGSDTAEFLREKLLYLGLNEREANEFIIYWLPQMEDNNYNYIYFSEEEYTESAKLDIAPNPDTLIRIMMAWEPLDTPRVVTEQKLTKAPERCGFTAVEWGGACIR